MNLEDGQARILFSYGHIVEQLLVGFVVLVFLAGFAKLACVFSHPLLPHGLWLVFCAVVGVAWLGVALVWLGWAAKMVMWTVRIKIMLRELVAGRHGEEVQR